MRGSWFLSDLIIAPEPGCPLTRPSGTLSPSEGERDGVRGRLMGSGLLQKLDVRWDHEPLLVSPLPALSPQGGERGWFMESQVARAPDQSAARPDEIAISLSRYDKTGRHRKAALSEQRQVRAFSAAAFDFGGAGFFKLEQVFHERLLAICSFWRAITRRRTKRSRR